MRHRLQPCGKNKKISNEELEVKKKAIDEKLEVGVGGKEGYARNDLPTRKIRNLHLTAE